MAFLFGRIDHDIFLRALLDQRSRHAGVNEVDKLVQVPLFGGVYVKLLTCGTVGADVVAATIAALTNDGDVLLSRFIGTGRRRRRRQSLLAGDLSIGPRISIFLASFVDLTLALQVGRKERRSVGGSRATVRTRARPWQDEPHLFVLFFATFDAKDRKDVNVRRM